MTIGIDILGNGNFAPISRLQYLFSERTARVLCGYIIQKERKKKVDHMITSCYLDLEGQNNK